MIVRRLALLLVLFIWLVFLVCVREARWNIGATYFNSVSAGRAELPAPTRYLALPVLFHGDSAALTGLAASAEIRPGSVMLIHVSFWLALFLPPAVLSAVIWEVRSAEVLHRLWLYGATCYGIVAIILIASVAFSMWLPFQRW